MIFQQPAVGMPTTTTMADPISDANALLAVEETSALDGPSTREPLTTRLGAGSARQSYPARHQKIFWVKPSVANGRLGQAPVIGKAVHRSGVPYQNCPPVGVRRYGAGGTNEGSGAWVAGHEVGVGIGDTVAARDVTCAPHEASDSANKPRTQAFPIVAGGLRQAIIDAYTPDARARFQQLAWWLRQRGPLAEASTHWLRDSMALDCGRALQSRTSPQRLGIDVGLKSLPLRQIRIHNRLNPRAV